MTQWERATDKQRDMIRYLENELDLSPRLSVEALGWMTKHDASVLIAKLNKRYQESKRPEQLVLL